MPQTGLHGFYSHGFPNLFHLGPLKDANPVNFAHIRFRVLGPWSPCARSG